MSNPDHGTEKWRVIMDGLKYVVDVLLKIAVIVLAIVTAIAQPVSVYLQLRNGTKIDNAADKADVAATIGAKVEDAVTKELVPAAISSNAINTEWKAGRTGNPEDKAKADTAAAKVMLQEKGEP